MSATWPTPEEARQYLMSGFEQAQASMPPDGEPRAAVHAGVRVALLRAQQEAEARGFEFDEPSYTALEASLGAVCDEIIAMPELRPLRTALGRQEFHPTARTHTIRRPVAYPSLDDEDDGPMAEFTSPKAAAQEVCRAILEHDREFRDVLLGRRRARTAMLRRIRDVGCQIGVEVAARRFPPIASFFDAVREVGDAVGAEWVVEQPARRDVAQTA